jgi:hypothetical protein
MHLKIKYRFLKFTFCNEHCVEISITQTKQPKSTILKNILFLENKFPSYLDKTNVRPCKQKNSTLFVPCVFLALLTKARLLCLDFKFIIVA